MKKLVLIPLLLSFGLLAAPSSAGELTPEQIESLRARLKAMKESLQNHLSSRNSTAGQRFMNAASDPKAAIDLYLECEKLVNYEREGRPESDFRAWKDEQSDRLRDPQFVESLQHQLRYLALSCQAAEAESIDAVFSPLMSFVDGLSRMEELPTNAVTQSVENSIFAKAFYLDKLLGSNEQWESTPFNIGGIYSRTILPYLRENKPEALMTAWDKRIEQETRLTLMLEEHKEKELRGMSRDQERRARGQQARQGGVLQSFDKDDFTTKTLPRLKWGKLMDKYRHVDELLAATEMLKFVEEHLTHELGEDFFNEFESTVLENDGTSSEVIVGP